MPTPIRIHAGSVVIRAELNDSETAQEIAQQLPIEALGNWWGDEIYFELPVSFDAAPEARAEFEVGELGYWPPGQAFCIFFGPTPVSTDATPKMANPGNPIGQTIDDPQMYHQIPPGSLIRVELAE